MVSWETSEARPSKEPDTTQTGRVGDTWRETSEDRHRESRTPPAGKRRKRELRTPTVNCLGNKLFCCVSWRQLYQSITQSRQTGDDTFILSIWWSHTRSTFKDINQPWPTRAFCIHSACPRSDFAKRSFCLVAKPAMSLRNRKAIRPIMTSAKSHSERQRRELQLLRAQTTRDSLQIQQVQFAAYTVALGITFLGTWIACHHVDAWAALSQRKWYNRHVATHQNARHSLEPNDLPN